MLTKSAKLVFSFLCVLIAGLLLPATLAFADDPIVSFVAAPGSRSSGPSGMTLTWRTGLELGTAGFHVYRGNEQGGPLEKLNSHLIPVGTDAIAGGTYSYVDGSAEPGQTYRYQLETIGLDGNAFKSKVLVSRMPMAATVNAEVVPLLPFWLALSLMVGTVTIVRRSPRMREGLRAAYLSIR